MRSPWAIAAAVLGLLAVPVGAYFIATGPAWAGWALFAFAVLAYVTAIAVGRTAQRRW